MANLEPDKARDQAMQAEAEAAMSKEKGEALVSGFDKYRTFIGDGIYKPVDLGK